MDFKTAQAHGQTFVFAERGEGPAVVLFHGFPDTPHGWADTLDALDGHRVIVPYLRGYHPDTIVEGRRYRGTELGEDAIRLLDAIGEQRAVLVGHDWGAAVVFRAAALAPERVRAVGAVAIPHPRVLKPSLGLLWKARHFVTLTLPTGRWLASHDDFAYIDTLMSRWAPNWTGPARDATLAEVKRAFSDPRVLDAALAYYRDAKRGEGGDVLPQPGLVVGGTDDLIPAETFRASTGGFEGRCELLIAEGAGHWPHREAADAFHTRLRGFLAGLTHE